MLILTRRMDETVMIGDTVKVTVLGIKGNQVRLGIEAPKSVLVYREEIYVRIEREKKQRAAKQAAAAQSSGGSVNSIASYSG